jgi:hypothetical protein
MNAARQSEADRAASFFAKRLNMYHRHARESISDKHTIDELLEARRAVALAKLAEFRRQCWRLADLVERGTLAKPDALDLLIEIAIAHALVRSMGRDRVEAIITEAFADRDHPVMLREAA